jgi:hypothetical protein
LANLYNGNNRIWFLYNHAITQFEFPAFRFWLCTLNSNYQSWNVDRLILIEKKSWK